MLAEAGRAVIGSERDERAHVLVVLGNVNMLALVVYVIHVFLSERVFHREDADRDDDDLCCLLRTDAQSRSAS